MAPRRREPQEVFDFADCSGGPDACWPFLLSLTHNGYGQFIRGRAHRVAWEVVNGPIPEGMEVLHSCDYRRCINPSHLFLGTQLDNVHDCIQKGRRHGTRLTQEQVEEIIRRGNLWESRKEIAKHFNISIVTVGKILRRESWKHLN